MREIKFRFWLIDKKEMVNQPKEIVVGEDIAWYCKAIPGKAITMQYTGLKDKNGKEIYEGDIIEHPNCSVWKVYFAKGVAAFRLSLIEDEDYMDIGIDETMEVIGNIYENPELLEEKI